MTRSWSRLCIDHRHARRVCVRLRAVCACACVRARVEVCACGACVGPVRVGNADGTCKRAFHTCSDCSSRTGASLPFKIFVTWRMVRHPNCGYGHPPHQVRPSPCADNRETARSSQRSPSRGLHHNLSIQSLSSCASHPHTHRRLDDPPRCLVMLGHSAANVALGRYEKDAEGGVSTTMTPNRRCVTRILHVKCHRHVIFCMSYDSCMLHEV
jgi:hypothetical protein